MRELNFIVGEPAKMRKGLKAEYGTDGRYDRSAYISCRLGNACAGLNLADGVMIEDYSDRYLNPPGFYSWEAVESPTSYKRSGE